RCNNNCIWCRGGHRNFMATENDLDVKVMKRVVKELADYGVKGIVRFSGMTGEPLMNEGTLGAIRTGIDLGLNVGLITNGILLDSKARDYLIDSTYVSVSLDAGTSKTFNNLKGHSTEVFEVILNNMKRFAELRRDRESKTRFGAGFMIHPGNYFEAVAAAKRVKETGADMIQFKVPYFLGSAAFTQEHLPAVLRSLEEAREYSDDNFKVFFMQQKGEQEKELTGLLPKPDFQKCYAQFINGVIAASGKVYPCVHFGYNTGLSGQAMGDVYNESFKEIWEGDKRAKMIDKICPSSDCSICNRYDTRMNIFLDFLSEKGL
ncbi:MAG: radical SAM protein, partial [Nanoarchaeota archaeon]